VVLMVLGYLGSVATLCVAAGADVLPLGVFDSPLINAYVAPLEWYIDESGWPGSDAAAALIDQTIAAGIRVSDRKL
jgi:hypothetical protein